MKTKEEYRREEKTIGVANMTTKEGKRYTLKFYDFDGLPNKDEMNRILRFFDNDCVAFKTKNGTHFISFTLYNIPAKKLYRKAKRLSKKLNQDYGGGMRALVLRVAPKFKDKVIVSARPSFVKILKYPRKGTLSSYKHLRLYHTFMGLPSKICDYYWSNSCHMLNTELNLIYYSTGKMIDD